MKQFTRWAVALAACLALVVCGALADEAPGIHVQLDGQELAFTDAVPQVRDQRTFLPFRAVFEAMGAEVGYEGSVITAVRDGKTLTMTLDQTTATVTQNGKTTTITMDVAPYVDNATWRTYVPVRFAAQAFDCVVGWDQAAQTAIVIDTDKLLSSALEGKSFTYLEKLAELETKYDTGIWDMTGSFDADMSVMAMPMTMTGTMSGTTQDSDKMSMDMNMKMDMSQMMSMMALLGGQAPSAEDQAMFDALKTDGIDLSMQGDLAQGKLYMKMSSSPISQAGLDPDTWYQVDMAAIMQTVGMDWAQVMADAQDMDALTMVKGLLTTMEPDDAATAYTEIKTTVESTVNALCDDGFTLTNGLWVTDYAMAENDVEFSLTLALDLDGETLKGYSMGMGMTAQVEDQTMGMSMTVGLDSEDTMKAELTMDMAGLLTMDMTLDGKYAPGTTAPVTTPPEGATVVDYMELVASQMGANDPDLGIIGGADGPTTIVTTPLA